jgi:hypothetical protein
VRLSNCHLLVGRQRADVYVADFNVVDVDVVVTWPSMCRRSRGEHKKDHKKRGPQKGVRNRLLPRTTKRCQEPFIAGWGCDLSIVLLWDDPKRSAPGGWIYHVLNRANERLPIFTKDEASLHSRLRLSRRWLAR